MPETIVLTCADDGLGLMHLHWTRWTPELASAYGTEWERVCVPYCAASNTYAYYPVVAIGHLRQAAASLPQTSSRFHPDQAGMTATSSDHRPIWVSRA